MISYLLLQATAAEHLWCYGNTTWPAAAHWLRTTATTSRNSIAILSACLQHLIAGIVLPPLPIQKRTYCIAAQMLQQCHLPTLQVTLQVQSKWLLQPPHLLHWLAPRLLLVCWAAA
jgi:hypothetical protein